jgi:hypothetical protein
MMASPLKLMVYAVQNHFLRALQAKFSFKICWQFYFLKRKGERTTPDNFSNVNKIDLSLSLSLSLSLCES